MGQANAFGPTSIEKFHIAIKTSKLINFDVHPRCYTIVSRPDWPRNQNWGLPDANFLMSISISRVKYQSHSRFGVFGFGFGVEDSDVILVLVLKDSLRTKILQVHALAPVIGRSLVLYCWLLTLDIQYC